MKTVSLTFLAGAAILSQLNAAQVDLTTNKVKSDRTSLKAGSGIAEGGSLSTGSKSKTQVSLGSNGSLLRAGSKTDLILKNDQSLSLKQGVMLASSGKRALGREAVSVETPEVRATAKGSMLIAYQPDVYVKITCVEGTVTVKLKAALGEAVKLRAGQMLIINPASNRLPDEVEVDLRELNATSALLNADFPELGASSRLSGAVDKQARGIGNGTVVRTPLILKGAGLEVSIDINAGIEAQRGGDAPAPVPPPAPAPPPVRSGSSGGTPDVAPEPIEPQPVLPEYIIDGTTVFNTDSSLPTLQTPGYPLISGAAALDGTTWSFANLNPSATPELLFRGTVDIPASNYIDGDLFEADGNLTIGDGGATQLTGSAALGFDAAADLTVSGATISPASGNTYFNSDIPGLDLRAGRTASISDSTFTHRADIAIAAPTVAIRRSSITVNSSTSGNFISSSFSPGVEIYSPATSAATGSITIADSSMLRALAGAAYISISSNGAPISIANSTLQASGVIDLDAFNASADNLIDIRNATLSGDQIRARAYNSGDRDAIIINSSTFNAQRLIQFYALGASRLRFQGVNTLTLGSSGEAVLAGKTVQVDSGGSVNVGGNLRVYRDNDNYNKAGFGTLQATGSRQDLPFGSGPP